MAIRKDKDGNWIVDISNGFDPITLKQRRIVRKGYKTKKVAIEKIKLFKSDKKAKLYY